MQLALEFDEAEHAYTLGGIRIPSVTQVLSHGQDLSRIPAWTALRGTAFHLATELWDEGDLDLDSVDPLVEPHLNAYRKWKAATQPVFTHTEYRVYGEARGLAFAGTIDRVIGGVVLGDLKSGQPRKDHGAQLAAYKIAFQQRTGNDVRGLNGIYCDKTGTFTERFYDAAEYERIFIEKLCRYYDEVGRQ